MPNEVPTQTLAKAPATDAWAIQLAVAQGPHTGQTFSFDRHDTFLVGRSEEAHFSLPEKDQFFSRMHFLIEVNPPLCRLVDLKSKNGTLVNGQSVTNIDLKDGDEIRGGTTTILVRIPSHFSPLPPGEGPGVRADAPATALPSTAAGNAISTQTLHGFPSIAGYRLLAELGRGGMGVVYKAQRESDGREIALKTIIPKVRTKHDTGERFLREANILRQLQHPNIVAFEDMGQAGELLYFAMNLVTGIDANKLVQQEGPLPFGRATRLIQQVLDGLGHAHQKGFVHRDLKPANILLSPLPPGEGPGVRGDFLAMIADFGLARTYQESPMSGLTMSGEIGGTPQFMPPEQVLNFRAAKPAADQYSAAATLYFLLTGKLPYEPTKDVQLFFKRILHEEPVRIESRRADVPKGLADVIHRALAREPALRFADVLELKKALLPFGQ